MKIIPTPQGAPVADTWRQFFDKVGDVVEDGFSNISEICIAMGCGRNKAMDVIRREISAGKIEFKFFRPTGTRYPIKYYRPIPYEPQKTKAKSR